MSFSNVTTTQLTVTRRLGNREREHRNCNMDAHSLCPYLSMLQIFSMIYKEMEAIEANWQTKSKVFNVIWILGLSNIIPRFFPTCQTNASFDI